MHAIRYCSPPQLISRLTAKRDHSAPRGSTKQEFRRRKTDRREYRQEIALCIWGAAALSHSVEL
jgi:hypothetical protein